MYNPPKILLKQWKMLKKDCSNPIERKTSCGVPSGTMKKVDGHEAEAVFRGRKRFPSALIVTEAVRDERTGKQTASES